MRPRHVAVFAVVASFAAILLTPAASTVAQPEQSPSELRAENDRLREEVERLRAELAERDKQLERQTRLIEQLREALQRARSGPGAPDPESGDDAPAGDDPPPAAPIPTEPFASPASMRAHLQAMHAERFASPNLDDARARRAYVQELRAWARDASRTGTGPVEWRVRAETLAEAPGSAVDATLVVVDAASGLPVGEPFTVRVTGRNATRLNDAGEGAIWIVDGILRTEIRVDESATDAAMTSEGAFIGPFAVFTFDVAVRALRDAA